MDCAPHDKFAPQSWALPRMKKIVNKWQHMMLTSHGWNALYLENHDQPRTISRFASDLPRFRKVSAKMLATFLALQSGTPYIYQGQEIGQINLPREWGLDRYRDIETLNHWQKVLREHPDDKAFQEMTLREYRAKGRDNARTPMQWDKSANAGFTKAEKPWIDVHPDYEEWNVENQVDDPDSVFSYWKAVLALRRELKDIFVYGEFEMLDPDEEDCVAYVRRFDEGNEALVVTSFRDRQVEWEVPEEARELLKCSVRLENYKDERKLLGNGGKLTLRPFEALVFVRSG
jgi:glycosidase